MSVCCSSSQIQHIDCERANDLYSGLEKVKILHHGCLTKTNAKRDVQSCNFINATAYILDLCHTDSDMQMRVEPTAASACKSDALLRLLDKTEQNDCPANAF